MIRQDIKDLYFLAVKWLARPNYWRVRIRHKFNIGSEPLRLHLGCGDEYIAGMVNIDGNFLRKKEYWLDLRNGLPFSKNSVNFVYCSHTLEHLYPSEAVALLAEIFRVLQPGSSARIAVPSFEHAMQITRGEATSHWPRTFSSPDAQAVNYLFCDGQHKYGYTSEVLSEFASKAGFKKWDDVTLTSGTQKKTYAGVTVGEEPAGSLVFELIA